ncbi:hypothetical protein L1987_38228 [Smallanthus sonchifolius]|uniref:Uncharacterized protein n=1 Tax=Smallanthus sonchifolius TaxID=185202 RepID=A0ACB9HJT2_9ASTR|nr:hypothetical protein L1987_38228 [Smallanthus sonchifolius]
MGSPPVVVWTKIKSVEPIIKGMLNLTFTRATIPILGFHKGFTAHSCNYLVFRVCSKEEVKLIEGNGAKLLLDL